MVFVIFYLTPTLTPVSRTGHDGEGDETEREKTFLRVVSVFYVLLKNAKGTKDRIAALGLKILAMLSPKFRHLAA